jgi:hypothetical protein
MRQIIGGMNFYLFNGACIILMVAAMASSIYIMGILVSDDKNTRILSAKCFVKNIDA